MSEEIPNENLCTPEAKKYLEDTSNHFVRYLGLVADRGTSELKHRVENDIPDDLPDEQFVRAVKREVLKKRRKRKQNSNYRNSSWTYPELSDRSITVDTSGADIRTDAINAVVDHINRNSEITFEGTTASIQIDSNAIDAAIEEITHSISIGSTRLSQSDE